MIRPFAKVEAKIIIPTGLSIKSGRRAPMAKYFGSIIVLSGVLKSQVRRILPM